MIQRTARLIEARSLDANEPTWQQLLSSAITSPETLLDRLGLDARQWAEGAREGHQLFSIMVPEPYLARIEYGNASDPLLLQVLPKLEETESVSGYSTDPLAEAQAVTTTGLIQKYKSRALLMVTGQCAINCRYCFRRHFPYNEHRLSPDQRQQILDALASDPQINEVIFSGGDPLLANDRLLASWADSLANLSHIRRLRIHTRLPIVIPQRVDDKLLSWLQSSALQTVIVVHVNHPNELDGRVQAALTQLKDAGVTLLNQSVILHGVNDDPNVLCTLSERLFECGVLPYYLHAFDAVAGAHHFAVGDEKARALVREMLGRLPGFLIPRLVREIPGKPGKTPIDLFA